MQRALREREVHSLLRALLQGELLDRWAVQCHRLSAWDAVASHPDYCLPEQTYAAAAVRLKEQQ